MQHHQSLCRGSGDSMHARKAQATRETPARDRAHDQPTTREGWVGRGGVAEGLVLLWKSGNADGGKEPWFKANAGSNKEPRLGQPYKTRVVAGVAKCMPCGSEGRTRTLQCSRNPPAGNGRIGWLREGPCQLEPGTRTWLLHHRHRHTRPSVGESMMPCPRAGCGNPPVRFDERRLETEPWRG